MCNPEYKKALEDQLGDGALEKFDQSAKDNMKDMNNYSKFFIYNFKKLFMNNMMIFIYGHLNRLLF